MVVYSVFVFKIILASCISKYKERSADRKWLLLWDRSFDSLPLQFSVMVIHYIWLSFQCRLKRLCAYYPTEQYTFKSGSTESMFLNNFSKKKRKRRLLRYNRISPIFVQGHCCHNPNLEGCQEIVTQNVRLHLVRFLDPTSVSWSWCSLRFHLCNSTKRKSCHIYRHLFWQAISY